MFSLICSLHVFVYHTFYMLVRALILICVLQSVVLIILGSTRRAAHRNFF